MARPEVQEEELAGEAAACRATRLARHKAMDVAARHPKAWVIGSDQVAMLQSEVLHKPGSVTRCVEQLLACSGQQVHFHTATALCTGARGAVAEYLDKTVVRFRQLSRSEIEEYVRREAPLDCAGGFKIEGLGIRLFERIDSTDPTALIGLPMIWLSGALAEAGFDPLSPTQG